MQRLIEDRNIGTENLYFTDLNDSKVFVSDFRGKAVIIISSTQRSAKESEKWGKALKSAYNDSVVFINTAFIEKEPPASIKTLVKSLLKRGYGNVPFLINWGKSSDLSIASGGDCTHISFIDPQGCLRMEFAEKYSDDSLTKFVENAKKYV